MQLTRREKNGFVLIALCLVGLGVYSGLFKPAGERIHTLQRVIPERQGELEQITKMSHAYVQLCGELDKIHHYSTEDNNVDLLPVIETLLRRYKLADQVSSMKQESHPIDDHVWESSVTIDWEQVELSPVIEFLAAIRQSQGQLRISGLTINKTVSPEGRLKVTVRICCLNVQS